MSNSTVLLGSGTSVGEALEWMEADELTLAQVHAWASVTPLDAREVAGFALVAEFLEPIEGNVEGLSYFADILARQNVLSKEAGRREGKSEAKSASVSGGMVTMSVKDEKGTLVIRGLPGFSPRIGTWFYGLGLVRLAKPTVMLVILQFIQNSFAKMSWGRGMARGKGYPKATVDALVRWYKEGAERFEAILKEERAKETKEALASVERN